MSNYNVTRLFRSTRYSLKGGLVEQRVVEHTSFLKKIATYQWVYVSEWKGETNTRRSPKNCVKKKGGALFLSQEVHFSPSLWKYQFEQWRFLFVAI